MKLTNLAMIAITALMLVCLVTGCQTPLTESTDQSDLLTQPQETDLDAPYGGFNITDEAPAFGDPMLTAEYGPDAAYDDALVGEPEVGFEARYRMRQRYLMITWGNLDADTTIDFVTDWSGSLSVDNGIIQLKRTIRFDEQDEILPRTSRSSLEWISYTRPHFDGVLVRLIKTGLADSTCHDSTAVDIVRPKLSVTFSTGPLTVTINEDDLKDLHRIVTVDDAGNAVAFNTITVEPNDCGGGFMAGQWHDVTDRPGGVFRGKWISQNGLHMGYLRGVYGPNSRGEKVFFGKWIGQGGNFKGMLRGHYGSLDVRPGGWFEGVWLGPNLRVRGKVRGAWRTNDDGRGHFRGTWRRACNASINS